MKNMKLSTRLFLSFGILLVLLMGVIGLDYISISELRASKDRLVNAEAINSSTQLTRRWTLDYYATGVEESAHNVTKNYNVTKMLMDEGLSLYKSAEEQDTINSMKSNLDLYHESFIKYKEYVEKNEAYSTAMVHDVDNILAKLDRLIAGQEKDFDSFITEVNSLKSTSKVNITELASQMEKEYSEVLTSNQTIISTQSVMLAELRYLIHQADVYDDEVYTRLETLRERCDWLYNNFDKSADKGSINEIRLYIDEFIVKYEKYKTALDLQAAEKDLLSELSYNITNDAETLALTQVEKMDSDMTSTIFRALIIGAISVIIVLLLAFFITRSLVKQLKKSMDKLTNSAGLVSSTSSQLAGAGQQLSEGSAEQAASIEQTSATMDETSSMVKQNAQHTKQANELSMEASNAAAEGSNKMHGMTKSMDELKKSSAEIAKIIKVIDEIAFQTNMLALNAAVEAARAGDAGLGFAVVAEEVRNLAQKSAMAAKDTTEIIDKNIELSQQGVIISDDVNTSLEEIMTKTNNVNQIMSEIAAASEEQSKGTAQVTQAIGEMEKVVQMNAATAQESAASATDLQTQAQALEGVVSELSSLVKKATAEGAKENIKMLKNEKKKKLKEKRKKVKQLASNKSSNSKKHIVSPDDVIPLDDSDEF